MKKVSKKFSLRTNEDCSNIAIDFTNNEGKWVTQTIYKDIDDQEIPAWKVLREINKLMYLGYAPKNITGIVEQSNDQVLKFL